MPIRILIADDHTLFRAGLRALLEHETDFEVVGEAANGHETLSQLEKTSPEVLIMDLSMPGGMSGAQTGEGALKGRPDLALIVLTMHEDPYYLREMLRIGAKAFLLKKSSSQELIQAVHAVMRGDVFVDPALTGHLVPSFVGKREVRKKDEGRIGLLTKREKEVCHLLALGHTNSEVGKKLFISERTVETHRTNIMAKLELRNRAELVRFAIDNGLLSVL